MNGIKIGEIYDYFDDGKIRPTRRYKVKITDIVPFEEIDEKTMNEWEVEKNQAEWIYKKESDFFIYGDLYIEPEIKKIVFVRGLKNTWFSLGFWGGFLDYDGSLLEQMEKRKI